MPFLGTFLLISTKYTSYNQTQQSNDKNMFHYFQDPMFRVPHYNFHELISWVLRTRNPTSAPGSVYSYSNFGYCVLGRVIEKLTRKSYVNYVKDAILKPSGISDMEIGTNTAIYNEATYYDSWSGLYTMPITRM